jgi:hypothetical protein
VSRSAESLWNSRKPAGHPEDIAAGPYKQVEKRCLDNGFTGRKSQQ